MQTRNITPSLPAVEAYHMGLKVEVLFEDFSQTYPWKISYLHACASHIWIFAQTIQIAVSLKKKKKSLVCKS